MKTNAQNKKLAMMQLNMQQIENLSDTVSLQGGAKCDGNLSPIIYKIDEKPGFLYRIAGQPDAQCPPKKGKGEPENL